MPVEQPPLACPDVKQTHALPPKTRNLAFVRPPETVNVAGRDMDNWRKSEKKRKKSPPGGGLESIFLEENRGDKCIMLRCHIFFQLSFQISEISAANI
jgi:hypothetical protein